MWDVDRRHLTADGHRRVAEAVWQTLGYEADDPEWRTPIPLTSPPGWTARQVAHARFTRQYLLPWIVRRLTGRSSGDGRSGAQFSAELGQAFWVTSADHTDPGPVTDWRRVEPCPGAFPHSPAVVVAGRHG